MKRRTFLHTAGMLGAASLLLPRGAQASRRAPDFDDAAGLLHKLVDEAMRCGATYADARYMLTHNQSLQVRRDAVYSVLDSNTEGVALRAYKDGNWGFAAAADVDTADPRALASRACALASEAGALGTVPFVREGRLAGNTLEWTTPHETDPFLVPVKEKVEFLTSILQPATKNSRLAYSVANLFQTKRQVRFYSSLDASTSQIFFQIYPNFAVTAFDGSSRRIDSRAGSTEPMAGGYELLTSYPFDTEVWKAGDEAIEMQQAAPVPTGEYDLILDPSYFARVLLETLLPQLDPMTVHGFSGDVPAAPLFPASEIGSAQVASELLNLRFDNTLQKGLATYGWDDAGRPAGSGTIVQKGVLTGLPWCEEIPSSGSPLHGSSRAAQWSGTPRFAMPNIVLAPSEGGRTLDEMIANTERGILLSGKGTTERSMNRRWFRGDAQAAWLIEKGKKTRAVREYAVDAALQYFWSNLSEIGGAKDARLCGDLFPQNAHANWELPFSLSLPPARFKRISVLNQREAGR